jgi:hypothetical protein
MRPQAVLILPIYICSALAQSATVPLVIDSGSPIRVYLTKRLTKRAGEPVEAKLAEPLFAFDREVVPAGSLVLGRISRTEGVSKMKRTVSILGGDFTPLRVAEVEFDTLVLPDGKRISLHTRESKGLNTIMRLHPAKPAKTATNNGGVLGTAKQQAQTQIQAAKQKVQDLKDMVRGPDKKENLEDFVFSKLPYHPQWIKKGTRFDAELMDPLQFGSVELSNDAMRLAGTQPPPDSVAHVRLITGLNSGDTKPSSQVVVALTQPLFSTEHKLIFPEGTRLTGAVTEVRRARWFHRGGHLRFTFQGVELPAVLANRVNTQDQPSTLVSRTQATVSGVESAGAGKVKVDSEGGITATEPKTRFIAPALSAIIAHRAADNDSGHINGGNSNEGGRTLGGASGFGMLGAAAAQASRTVGTIFGFWGMALSVYSNIISKGSEAEFEQNAAMDVRFGARPPSQASKFVGSGSY